MSMPSDQFNTGMTEDARDGQEEACRTLEEEEVQSKIQNPKPSDPCPNSPSLLIEILRNQRLIPPGFVVKNLQN